jgi:hypothetical protein
MRRLHFSTPHQPSRHYSGLQWILKTVSSRSQETVASFPCPRLERRRSVPLATQNSKCGSLAPGFCIDRDGVEIGRYDDSEIQRQARKLATAEKVFRGN